jgi:hypothetical protein
MYEFLRMLLALTAQEAVVNIPIVRGGQIAQALTEYKYGVSLTVS